MRGFFRGLVALLRISKEVRRIRQILEIAYSRELSIHDAYKNTTIDPNRPFSEVVIDTSPYFKRDAYGKIIDEEEEQQQQ